MTATSIPALLEPIQERLDAATPGPWKADVSVRGDCVVWGPNGRFLMNAQAEPHWLEYPGETRMVSFDVDRRDAVFIAAAPTDTARLLAAVKAVTEVHKPAKVQRTKYNAEGTLISYTVTEDGPCVVCYPPFITQHCEDCDDYDETCGGVTGAASRPWPCPTVSAVEAALKGEA